MMDEDGFRICCFGISFDVSIPPSSAAMVIGSKVLIQEVEKCPLKKYKKVQQLKSEKKCKKCLKNVPKKCSKVDSKMR